jgi:hypothetical protein
MTKDKEEEVDERRMCTVSVDEDDGDGDGNDGE